MHEYNYQKKRLSAIALGEFKNPINVVNYIPNSSSIIPLDFDKLDKVGPDELMRLKDILRATPEIVFCFTSISGAGLKAGLCVGPIKDDARYKRCFAYAKEWIKSIDNGLIMDDSGSDVRRLIFTSYDPEAYFNPTATTLNIPIDFAVPSIHYDKLQQTDRSKLNSTTLALMGGFEDAFPCNEYNKDTLRIAVGELYKASGNTLSEDAWYKEVLCPLKNLTTVGWFEEDAYALFDEVCRQMEGYNEEKNYSRWNAQIPPSSGRPKTYKSLLNFAPKERLASLKPKEVAIDDIIIPADFNESAYTALKDKLTQVSLNAFPETKRQMLAQDIFDVWGKAAGLTKSAIKKELQPNKDLMLNNLSLEERSGWAENWVYVERINRFANTKLNYTIKTEAFNAKYGRDCPIEFSASFYALNLIEIPLVVDYMFWPKAATFFTHEGLSMLNSYTAKGELAKVKPNYLSTYKLDDDGQQVIDLFLYHINFLLSDERERVILLDWMTHIITKPSERVNWAVLLQGAQGSGKSYIAFVLQLLIGSNAKLLATSALKGTFTAWAQGAIVNIVEEIRIAGDNKWEILDRLKAFIGNDEIPIEEKGVDHKTVPNFTSYFFLTNHPNAIPLTDEDRRYCVLSGAIQSLDALNAALGGPVGVEQYFTKLFDESKRRPDVLLYFFMTREISSDFKPKGRAPITEGIGQMIAYAVSEDTETVLDFITKYNNGVINEKVLDITLLSKLSAPIFFGGKCLPATSKLKNTLLDLGYRRVKDRVNIPGTKTKHTVWFKEPFTEKLAIDDFKAFYADPKNASHSI